jgi:hypothetical protein
VEQSFETHVGQALSPNTAYFFQPGFRSEPDVGWAILPAILPADQLSSWSSRLKGGCGHDWPPHEEKYAVLGAFACPLSVSKV